jgi:hypothetical protein
LFSAGLPATRGALVNPLIYEHAPRSLLNVLGAVSGFTKINETVLANFASVQSKLGKLSAAEDALLRGTLVDSMTRLERMTGLALKALDKETKHLGLAAQPDPADDAMTESIQKILKKPWVSPPQP